MRSFPVFRKHGDPLGVASAGEIGVKIQIDYIEGDAIPFEKAPMEALARDGELMAYCHDGFWQCMDTQRDKQLLEKLWADGTAPWKVW